MVDAYMDNEELYRANTSGVMLRESEAPNEIVTNSQLTNGEKMDINEVIALLETIPVELEKGLNEHRTAARYRATIETGVTQVVSKACEHLRAIKGQIEKFDRFGNNLLDMFREKGIESSDDLEDYMRTTERDGAVIADLCELLNTNVFQITQKVSELKQGPREEGQRDETSVDRNSYPLGEPTIENLKQRQFGDTERKDGVQIQPRRTIRRMHEVTGTSYAPLWTQPSRSWEERRTEMEAPGQEARFMAFLQAATCVDPGVFKGRENESYREFVRRFRRKYCPVIKDDNALIDIFGDDHLGGRAKSIFLAMPEYIKGQGFEAVVRELGNLVAGDSTAARMRALMELRNIRIRAGQSIADFCVALEKLAKKANPDGSAEDRSMELSQILLENIKEWPEHVQILGALYNVEPRRAYDKVKELALGIEQSRTVFGKGNTRYGFRNRYAWKERAREYEEGRSGVTKPYKSRGTECVGSVEKVQREERVKPGREWPVSRQEMTSEQMTQNAHVSQSRKCYNCSRYGHVARNCPQREVRTGERNEDAREKQQDGARNSLSSLIQKVRSLGLEVKKVGTSRSELIGNPTVTKVTLLNRTARALLDSGSMISIIPLDILVNAQKEGYDVDSLELLSEHNMETVYDASNNLMTFLGVVRIPVALEGGRAEKVAFHISERKDCEILLGTNALGKLGVKITITSESEQEEVVNAQQAWSESLVTVAARAVIPPFSCRLVAATCNVPEGVSEVVVWPKKQGVTNGVFRISNDEIMIPIHNVDDQPLVLQKGDELGEWWSEKWCERWEDCAMLDQDDSVMNEKEKKKLLIEQISQNSSQECLDSDLKAALVKHANSFAVCEKELGHTELAEMKIDTGNHDPIKLKTRPVPLGIRPKLREMLRDLEERKIIEKSNSDWAFPIVLVEKKDGGIRLCVDYRELNKCIKQDSYPIPTIDSILQSLAGKRYFSTLDMCSGYWQIPLAEETKHKSAFTTPEGLFQFRVTPFGLSTSPATFQRLMDTVLSGLLGDEVFCYIDDIMIATSDRERHLQLLSEVCERMEQAGLKLKAKKCVLLQSGVSFLGHMIDQEGVHMDKQKVEAVERYPSPTNAKDLRSFLGMASFYRKFCLNFSKIASPLFGLTSPKAKWRWEREHVEAFQKLKEMITSAPVLTQPNIEKARSGERPFIIFTDASTTGIGAVLSQEGDDKQLHPIFFASKSLSKAEKKYHITDLEALGVVFAVRRFHMFIYGIPTVVKTDHQPLTALFKRNNISSRVLRWSLELQRYNLQIQYLKGRANAVADALSRGPVAEKEERTSEPLQEAVVCAVQEPGRSKWLRELEREEDWAQVIKLVQKNDIEKVVKISGIKEPVRVADFQIEGGELKMYREDGSLVFVVPKSAQYEVFFEAHSGLLAGHFSAYKLLNLLRKQVFWPDMSRDVHKWTKQCQRCYVTNPQRMTVPPLKPIVTSKPYEIVGVDILELGLTTAGNRYAVTVVDHFSKFAAAYPVGDKSAETVAKTIFLRWIADGCRWPKSILSDRGGEFENKVMEEIEKIAGINHIFTKGYNPRENGITERLNGTIVAMLRRSTSIPSEWDLRLPFCIMAYNMTPHSSTGESPYFVLHGIDPTFPSSVIPNPGISWYAIDNAMDDYKTAIVQGIVEVHERVKEYNDRIRKRMKKMYDTDHKVDTTKHPKVGERVYLRIPTEKVKSAHPKLISEWSGPYRVLEVSENSATISRIGEDSEALRIPFDQLLIVPPHFSDERVDTVTTRGKRGRKKGTKNLVQTIKVCSCRGAVLKTAKQPGHLRFECLDGCLMETKLSELTDVCFPGAFAKEPVGTVWKAWVACSIFKRSDVDLASKIRLYRQGAVCLDESALKPILRTAYERCTAWTEFLCETEKIKEHEKVENLTVVKMYDDALQALRQDLEDESRKMRPRKEGPVGYAAPEWASVMEKDGARGGIHTVVVRTFTELREKLNEWRSFSTWVLVWPADEGWTQDKIKEICSMCAQQVVEGGRVVSAWTPCTQANIKVWPKMIGVWKALDKTLAKGAGNEQFFPTSNAVVMNNKVFAEIGSPEGSIQFYGKYSGVGNARYLYENIRQRSSIQLPPMYAPPRASATRRGGMSWPQDGDQAPPPKRASL